MADPLTDRRAAVVLDAEPEATTSQVGAAIVGLLRPGARAATLYVEGTAVDPRVPLSASPLRDGALVSLDDPAAGASGQVEIRVVSGSDADGVFRLDPGVAQIGTDQGAAVPVDDPSLPPITRRGPRLTRSRPCWGDLPGHPGEVSRVATRPGL